MVSCRLGIVEAYAPSTSEGGRYSATHRQAVDDVLGNNVPTHALDLSHKAIGLVCAETMQTIGCIFGSP